MSLQALIESRNHWVRMRDMVTFENPTERPDANCCALCNECGYVEDYSDPECNKCDIGKYTKKEWCRYTPYHKARDAFARVWYKNTAKRHLAWSYAAQMMINFLDEVGRATYGDEYGY